MAKIKAKGLAVKYSSNGTTYNTIPQLAEGSLDLGSWDREDVTTHDTSGSTKDYELTMKEPPSIDVNVMLDPADTHHEALRAAYAAGTLLYWDFILTDTGAASYKFTGHITGLKLSGPLKGFLSASITIAGKSEATFTQ
jgi:predicted secreted protein